MWYVYILKCTDGSLYTGITNDLEGRVKTHRAGKGAAYTKSHPVLSCVYHEVLDSRSLAQKREWQIKQMSRSQKVDMIARQ